MIKFPFLSNSLKCAISVSTLPGRMLGCRTKLKPLPLFQEIGECASCNNNNNNNNNNDNHDDDDDNDNYNNNLEARSRLRPLPLS